MKYLQLLILTFSIISFTYAQDVNITWTDGYGNTKLTWEEFDNCIEAYDHYGSGYNQNGYAVFKCEPCSNGVYVTWWKPITSIEYKERKAMKISPDLKLVMTPNNSVMVKYENRLNARYLSLCDDRSKCYKETRYNTCQALENAVKQKQYEYPNGWRNVECEEINGQLIIKNGNNERDYKRLDKRNVKRMRSTSF